MEITKETTMGQMLEFDSGIANVLMRSGMHCVGCPSSIGESLEQACMVHGLDSDRVLHSIMEYLSVKKLLCNYTNSSQYKTCNNPDQAY